MWNVHYRRSVLTSHRGRAWHLVWVDKVIPGLRWDIGVNSSSLICIELTHFVHTGLEGSFTRRRHHIILLLEWIIRVILRVLLNFMRNYNFIDSIVGWSTWCLGLMPWIDILMHLVMNMIDILNVLLMIIWTIKVNIAVRNLMGRMRWWLIELTTSMAVGLTRFMIKVRHLIIWRLAWFFDINFYWVVRSFGII